MGTDDTRAAVVVVTTKRIIIAMTGASGLVYGIKLLELLRSTEFETQLVMSKSAQVALAYESSMKVKDINALADVVYDNRDVAAPISSGSYRTGGMIIAPCSAKTLGQMATGSGSTLIARAADVVLKERRRLVAMLRETPLHLGHCRNMVAATEMGAIIMPPVPAFYPMPETVDDIVSHTAARALDLFGVDGLDIKRWKEG